MEAQATLIDVCDESYYGVDKLLTGQYSSDNLILLYLNTIANCLQSNPCHTFNAGRCPQLQ